MDRFHLYSILTVYALDKPSLYAMLFQADPTRPPFENGIFRSEPEYSAMTGKLPFHTGKFHSGISIRRAGRISNSNFKFSSSTHDEHCRAAIPG